MDISSEPVRDTGQTDVLELACLPIGTVRIAFIGLGKRGKEAFNNFLYIEGGATLIFDAETGAEL